MPQKMEQHVILRRVSSNPATRATRSLVVAATAAAALVLTGCAPDATPAASSSTSTSTSTSGSAPSSESAVASSPEGSTSGVPAADVAEATAALVAPGKLTVCTHLPYPPFQSNDDSGKAVGFDVDMMQLVADVLGVEQAIVDTPFEGIKSGQDLNTGKCDIAAAGMTINADRQKVILFSEPYFAATQALLVRADSGITGLANLKGKRLAAQASTTGLAYANAHKDEFGYEVVEYPDLSSETQALTTNQADGAINDLPVWGNYMKTNPGTTSIAIQFDTGEQYGFGMKLGNTALKTVVDSAIERAKSDGAYDALYKQWIADVPAA